MHFVTAMPASFGRKGSKVLLCGSCMDACGLTDEERTQGAQCSTLDGLADREELIGDLEQARR
jgi:sulfur relay (sulfurtransferase) complex TusBCD TusD component (DsrE family)